MHERMGLGVEYVFLNNNIITDVRVRQAINYALNTPEIAHIISSGTALYASGYINPITFAHDPDFEPYPFDLDRARELMQEAGYSGEAGANDLAFTILSNGGNAARNQSAEIIENQLNEIGIDISIETPEFNAMMDEIRGGNVAMATLGWGTVTGDPDYALFPLFHSSAVSPSTNSSNFQNEEFDALIERGRTSLDPDERIEIYHEAQQILREYAPWVLLTNNIIRLPALNNVAGVDVVPHQGHFFGNIYFTD
jgi:peptide/nickel transport system substrate-binding protein